MKRLLPLVLAIASAAAADPLVIELPRAGGPLRVAVNGEEFEIRDAAGHRAVRAAAAKDAGGLRRSVAALAVAHPGSRIGLVGRLLGAPSRRQDRVVVTGRVVLAVPPGADPAAFLAARGLRQVQGFAWSARHVVAEPLQGGAMAAIDAAAAIRGVPGGWAEPELALPLAPLAEPTDPLYATQWHLKNLGTNVAGGVAGVDIGIVAHWTSLGTIRTGTGINVAVVDDGLDLTHPDLAAGVRTDIDSDPAGGDSDPSHSDPLGDGHGTVVGGLIGARANAVGGVGVAYGSSLVGVKMFLDGGATQTAVAAALGHRATATSDVIHVSNNSWGPRLGGTDTADLDSLSLAALTAGVDQGRGGRGTIYVFAAGNSRVVYDDLGFAVGNDTLDYNRYGSNRRVIAVGALKSNGTVASYSEPGIGLLLCAPGGDGTNGAMVSTDWQGDNGFQTGDYTQQDPPADPNADDVLPNSYEANGTSFAAPLVSGAAALLLEANPLLSWRDVPHVLAHSATPIAGVLNGAGLRFHADYGAGRLNVAGALALAATWTPLPPEASVTASGSAAALPIPDDGTMVSKDIVIAADGDFTVERADLTVSMTHTWRGDVEFRLVAPSGTVAAVTRRPADDTANLLSWTFSSVRTMGEAAAGTWRIEARDLATDDTGTLDACTLTLYGYRPYQAPVLTRIFPSAVLVTQPTTTVSVENSQPATSEGGDLLGAMTLGATVNATVARDAVGWASASIPAATFAALGGPGTYSVSLANPQVRGVNYALAGGGSGSINLTVRATNAVPVVATVANGAVVAGFPTTSGAASFTDADGDAMRYRLGTAPLNGTADVDLLTGVVTYTPLISSMGSDSLTVIATDGMGDSAPVTITYAVERNVSYGLNIGGSSGGSSGGGGGGGCGAGAVGLLVGLGALLGLRRRRR